MMASTLKTSPITSERIWILRANGGASKSF
jgi:hypothetical protein